MRGNIAFLAADLGYGSVRPWEGETGGDKRQRADQMLKNRE